MRASSDRRRAAMPWADAGRMRASDAERDQAVGELRDRFAEGRISQDTFLHRMDAALRAKDVSELSGLFSDLPGSGSPQPLARSRLARLRSAVADLLAAAGEARRRAGHAQAARQPAPWLAGAAAAPQAQARPLPLCLPPHAEGKFTIGRALACDFTLADLSVSRWHAKLRRGGEHWLLSDLGSTNGTRLNGWRVTTDVPVRPGDQVSFGSVTFVITERPVGAS